eukprot:1182624-Prorocentrum_minimum.AAC.1
MREPHVGRPLRRGAGPEAQMCPPCPPPLAGVAWGGVACHHCGGWWRGGDTLFDALDRLLDQSGTSHRNHSASWTNPVPPIGIIPPPGPIQYLPSESFRLLDQSSSSHRNRSTSWTNPVPPIGIIPPPGPI